MNGVAGGRWDGKSGGEEGTNQRKAGIDRWKDGQSGGDDDVLPGTYCKHSIHTRHRPDTEPHIHSAAKMLCYC